MHELVKGRHEELNPELRHERLHEARMLRARVGTSNYCDARLIGGIQRLQLHFLLVYFSVNCCLMFGGMTAIASVTF